MSEEEKSIIFIRHYLEDNTGVFGISKKDIGLLFNLYQQEKEKNEKYKAVAIKINNSVTQNGIVIFDVSNLTQKIEDLEDRIKKAIDYIDRWEINSIGTPFTYTAPGKELMKILAGKER